MVIAGEPSGDLLAAELVKALRTELAGAEPQPATDFQPLHNTLEPKFFGAGGPCMAQAGVELAFDMTTHAVVGLIEVLKNYRKFKKLFDQLVQLALDRQPDAIICVDFSGFNSRFGAAIKRYVRARRGPFSNWNPKLIQYVSPQVWASREGRAQKMARDFDLLLSIFPFEKEWYATHASRLNVKYVGHPMLDRYVSLSASPLPSDGRGLRGEGSGDYRGVNGESNALTGEREYGYAPAPGPFETDVSQPSSPQPAPPLRGGEGEARGLPLVLLLPGSRAGELRRHLAVIYEASRIIASKQSVRFQMCLPNQSLADQAAEFDWPANTTVQVGGLTESLSQADLAIASTGTVTMECAYFGVPTVAMYKTSWSTYEIGKRIIKVNFLAMPNLLAGDAIYPEFIQHAATPANISRAAVDFLENSPRREATRLKLAKVIGLLGGPGANQRAACAIVNLLAEKTSVGA
jgi:lipid-A-disaccharide synthase